MCRVKEINVKKDMHNCFDEMINIKSLNPNKIKMEEKTFSYKRSVIFKIKNYRCKTDQILIFCSLC